MHLFLKSLIMFREFLVEIWGKNAAILSKNAKFALTQSW